MNVDKNHTAYDEVLGEINFTKAHYNEQLQAFMKVAVDPQDFPGLYETMRTEAHNAFNEVNLGIVAVERKTERMRTIRPQKRDMRLTRTLWTVCTRKQTRCINSIRTVSKTMTIYTRL